MRDDLDIDSPFGRGHHDRALQAAVDRHAQIELAGDVVPDGDQHLGDGASLSTGLVGDQRFAQQAGGGFFRIGGRLDQLHPLGHRLGPGLLPAGDLEREGAIVVGPDRDSLAPAAGVHLGLDDDQPASERIVGFGGLRRSGRHDPFRNRDAGLLEQLFRLIFVNLHRASILILE